MLKVLKKIKELKELPDNWDSYSGKQIKQESIDAILSLLSKVNSYLSAINIKMPDPFIAPLGTGYLQVEWTYGDRDLEIEMVEKDTFVVLYEDDNDFHSEETNLNGAVNLTLKFFQGKKMK